MKLSITILSLLLFGCSIETLKPNKEVKACECQDQRTNNYNTEINYYEVVDKKYCQSWHLGDSLVPVENNNYYLN